MCIRDREKSLLYTPELLFSYAAKKEDLSNIDKVCITAAVQKLASIQYSGFIFLNVRPRSIIQGAFCEFLIENTAKYGFSPEQIVLELTEQQAILNPRDFYQNLKWIRSHGCKIALDDFGVGFSNFQMLDELKPEYIKLSGVFSRDLLHDAHKVTIIKKTVELAKQFKGEVIVENIEDEQTFKKVCSLSVSYAQGHYFAKPMEVQEFQRREHQKDYSTFSSLEKQGI